MEKILITGGAGFIGSTLAKALIRDYQVVVIDDLSFGKKENLPVSPHLTFVEESVCNQIVMEKILTTHKFKYIFHLAAIASVADSVQRPVETRTVNLNSVLYLLELVRKFQPELERLVFSSSAAVYGDEPSLPKSEESVIRPLTPYAIDKFAAERYVCIYQQLYQVPTSAVRFFNVYGPNQNPASPYSGVLSLLIQKYQELDYTEATPFTIFGDGQQSRDFVYIDDVIQALLLVAKHPAALGQQFNVGTGKSVSLFRSNSITKSLVG